MSETTEIRAALFGRLADDLTREVLPGHAFEAVLPASGQQALRKNDGYFVFTDLKPSTTNYEVSVNAPSYQRRTLSVNLPTTAAVEMTSPGEDELFAVVTSVDVAERRVRFDRIPFVPPIRSGARVLGPGAFSATLDQPLEGGNVDFAILSSVAALSAGNLLRFVRSPSLILAPGPYHPFAPNTTLVAVRVVENTAGDPAITSAAVAIDQVNSVGFTTTSIQGVNLHTATLSGSTRLLGADRAVQTRTNERGDAVFYLPSDTPITGVRLQISRPGFVPATQVSVVTPGHRVSNAIQLNRI